jgi:hypothetical protein
MWRRGGRDPGAPDQDHARDGRGCAEAGGSHGSQRQPPPLHLRALEQPHSRLGRALDAWPGARSAAGSGGRSTKAEDSSAVDLRPIPGPLDQPRSVICDSDNDGTRTPARPATRQRGLGRGRSSLTRRRASNCYDNAVCEGFHATLEKELLRRHSFRTRQEARTAIFDWIEGWYNRERRHSRLGYRSPADYELDHDERSDSATATDEGSSLKKEQELPNVYVSTEPGAVQASSGVLL